LELAKLRQLVKAGGTTADVVFDPALTPHARHFRGLFFQLVLVEDKGTGAAEMLAAGGRYGCPHLHSLTEMHTLTHTPTRFHTLSQPHITSSVLDITPRAHHLSPLQ